MSRNQGSVAGSRLIVGMIFGIFFCISLLTNILGPLIPDIISGFRISLGLAAVLPFAFFIAYGVMSIPAGFMVEEWGEKRLLVGALLGSTAGALAFALHPTYSVAIASLFTMGAGMAALQVAINPLLRVAGGPEHFAFNSTVAQLVFGSASFLSPMVYAYLVGHLQSGRSHDNFLLGVLAQLTPKDLAWVSVYWLFAVSTALLALLIGALRLPSIERAAEERSGSMGSYARLLRIGAVWAYFGSIFAYVGSEQGTADWISEFLQRYHGIDPHGGGARIVSYFWGLLTAGCLIGMLLLKFLDSRRVLIVFSLGALVALSIALFGSANASCLGFPCVGLFASIMWPTIAALALNSVAEHHGAFAGILCTGIMGGAVVPVLIGTIGDVFGLRAGMSVLYLTFGVILSVGFWARPLIDNARMAVPGRTRAGTA